VTDLLAKLRRCGIDDAADEIESLRSRLADLEAERTLIVARAENAEAALVAETAKNGRHAMRVTIAQLEARLAEAEALLRDAQTYAIDIQGFVLESGYKAGAVECADRIDAALSSTLGQGESGAYPAAEGMARAESVVTPGTPGGGASVEPSAATENPEAMYNPVALKSHAGASARQIDVAAGDPSALLYCEHPAALLVRSAETGEPLYCELCDDKSGRRDAEQREVDLGAALREAEELLRESFDWVGREPVPFDVPRVLTLRKCIDAHLARQP
jgi:hypothetical protein